MLKQWAKLEWVDLMDRRVWTKEGTIIITITIREEITITITMDKTLEAIKETVETEDIRMEEIKDKVNGNLLMVEKSNIKNPY